MYFSQDLAASAPRTKSKRRPNSCDSCRARKIKCRPTDTLTESGWPLCDACQEAALECRYFLAQSKQTKRQKSLATLVDSAKTLPFPAEGSSVPFRPIASTSRIQDVDRPIPIAGPSRLEADLTMASPVSSFTASPSANRPMIYGPTPWNERYTRFHLPEQGLRNLTDLAPLATIRKVIDVFFQHLHPLMPVLHQPSFIKEFEDGLYNVSPPFFAKVTSMLAVTLVQVPRSHIGIEDTALVAKLAKQASSLSCDAATRAGYEPVSLDWVVSRLFIATYNSMLGHMPDGLAAHSEAVMLANLLGITKPETYTNLNPIEEQLRLRTFWVLFIMDKTGAFMCDVPMMMAGDFGWPALVANVKDVAITAQGIDYSQRHDEGLLNGFILLCRICLTLFELIKMVRATNSNPISPASGFAAELDKLKRLEDQIICTMREAPAELRFHSTPSNDSLMLPIDVARDLAVPPISDFRQYNVLDMFENFDLPEAQFFGPPASDTNRKNALHVIMANTHITFLIVRLEILRYRQRLNIGLPPNLVDREMSLAVANSLLDVLVHLPLTALATNGKSLTRKVVYAARVLPNLMDQNEVQRLIKGYLDRLNQMGTELGYNYSIFG